MNIMKMKLCNCFGIQKMELDVDFASNNVAIIYASNGTMKSSLAKTFECIRDGKEIKERVYLSDSSYSIVNEDETDILPESIIVVNPFNENTFENQGRLMANVELRKKYLSIHKKIDEKKNYLYNELKTLLGYSSRSSFDVESALLEDWNSDKDNLFLCMEKIMKMIYDSDMMCSLKEEEIDYNKLFNDKVVNIFSSANTSELIDEYEKKYSELVEHSQYMQKGVIDHNNYAEISKSLSDNGFFNANNEIKLNQKDGSYSVMIKSQHELDDLINKEKEQILNTKELKDLFEKINKLIIKNKETQAFNDFIQNHPEIILEYKEIQKFKKKIWIKVFTKLEFELKDLLSDYKKAQNDLLDLRNLAKQETTDWNKALGLFKERFFVPFEIQADNQEDVILNLDMPTFKYIFSDNRGNKVVTKDNLLEVLSTGEKRAYYILNFIFQVLVAKKEGRECLIILDDVSDSFDYKNKHAIIEYISDISNYVDENGNKIFKVLLLTHNFDFYRTVASRLTKFRNSYIAFKDKGIIKFEKGYYTKNIFNYYKECIIKDDHDNLIVAAIPFVRNLIEYTAGKTDVDYLCLTSLLHFKNDTKVITLKDIQQIYKKHWFVNDSINFAEGREFDPIYPVIFTEADKIDNTEKINIENKLILSIAIRLKAEEYMINQIIGNVDGGLDIINEIYSNSNQSARLIKEYKLYMNDNLDIIEQVSMIIPENIHLNSFMFEPILDMSLLHLYELYQKVKALI